MQLANTNKQELLVTVCLSRTLYEIPNGCRRKNAMKHGVFAGLAERQGFEPWEGVNPLRLSRPTHSTTLPSLRVMSGGLYALYFCFQTRLLLYPFKFLLLFLCVVMVVIILVVAWKVCRVRQSHSQCSEKPGQRFGSDRVISLKNNRFSSCSAWFGASSGNYCPQFPPYVSCQDSIVTAKFFNKTLLFIHCDIPISNL